MPANIRYDRLLDIEPALSKLITLFFVVYQRLQH